MDMGKPVALNHFTINKDGTIEFGSSNGKEKPIEANLTTSYDRDNKNPKIINRLSISPDRLTIVPDLSLTRYNRVLAVDSNRPDGKKPNIVFTGIVLSKVSRYKKGCLLKIFQETVIEFHNLKYPSERFGWAFTLQSGINKPQNETVAMIVDHDLRSIPAINCRDEPILESFFLPKSFELLYASSDPGDKFIANDLLKLCDSNCRKVARIAASAPETSLPPLLSANFREPFTHIRVWDLSIELPSV